MSLIAALQPPDRESTVTVLANSANGVTAASGAALTFRFTAVNSNASPSASGGTSYVIYWGDNSTNTTSATSAVNQSVTATASPTHTYAAAGTYRGRIEHSTADLHVTKGTTYFTVVVS